MRLKDGGTQDIDLRAKPEKPLTECLLHMSTAENSRNQLILCEWDEMVIHLSKEYKDISTKKNRGIIFLKL